MIRSILEYSRGTGKRAPKRPRGPWASSPTVGITQDGRGASPSPGFCFTAVLGWCGA